MYPIAGTSSASVPLHAVEAHEHAVANEQSNPHEHVASAYRLVWQEDERNYSTEQVMQQPHDHVRLHKSAIFIIKCVKRTSKTQYKHRRTTRAGCTLCLCAQCTGWSKKSDTPVLILR